jgi:hypothetical protein
MRNSACQPPVPTVIRTVRTLLVTSSQTGASLRDLMQRIGHDSTAAAIRYQHASREADEAIAAALDDVIDAARQDPGSGA